MVDEMIFGMTMGEIGLTVFIFALVYCAGLLPRLADRLAALVVGRAK
jgi:hypothetical protein